eukprot:188119-Chlamydomonas_euryale.AAC.1
MGRLEKRTEVEQLNTAGMDLAGEGVSGYVVELLNVYPLDLHMAEKGTYNHLHPPHIRRPATCLSARHTSVGLLHVCRPATHPSACHTSVGLQHSRRPAT